MEYQSRMGKLLFNVLCGLMFSLFSAAAFAQTGGGTFGTILGVVSDETGAVVPKVTVSVTNQKTNITRTSMTNEEGFYQVSALLPGTYKVEVEATGFKKHLRPDIDLRVNESVRADVTLQVGEISQTVEV